MTKSNISFHDKITERLILIYGDRLNKAFTNQLVETVESHKSKTKSTQKWDEQDVVLITYGDSVKKAGEPGLKVLHRFLKKHLGDELSFVHILPFFPYSSDDGFSVIDYKKVNPELGTWKEIRDMNRDFKLMFDLVINHISQRSEWFQNYLAGKNPGKNYFIEADPDTDLSEVIRPRSLPLLTEFETSRGKKHVWTTFSNDQIDLDFSNPEVLYEMVNVLLHYLDNGASMIRMDAIAFLWKEIGTTCLHLPQTHEVVKLLREIMEEVHPDSILLTETNVPNRENLSYFGNGDEAHMVYQFSLPPLLLHALHTGNSKYFNRWAETIPELENDCTFFNFTASHDGIGVRPLEGILPGDELDELIEGMKSCGAQISTRRKSDGNDSPYEINVTYFDAMKQTHEGADDLQVERFLASQTIMMEMKGMPAFYIHSLLGTHNYTEGVEKTGRARTINRKKWDEDEIEKLLSKENEHAKILSELKRRIAIRKKQLAFHPNGRQKVLDAGGNFIILKRTSPEKSQEITCITNITGQNTRIAAGGFPGFDLLKGEEVKSIDNEIELHPYQTLWLV